MMPPYAASGEVALREEGEWLSITTADYSMQNQKVSAAM
jgi:hypothetical protein